MSEFLPGDRVKFQTVAGEFYGTVAYVHEDDVYTVRSDDGDFPRLLLLGRAMQLECDRPHVVAVG